MLIKPHISGTCKQESDFQWKLTKAYKDLGAFVNKLPDNSMSTKPYDMEMVLPDGITYHVECKITDELSINVHDLRPNQRASLWHISRLNPDIAWVFVYSRTAKEYYCMQYLQFREAASSIGTVKLFNSTWLIEKNL